MITKTRIYEAVSTDPERNLAMEEYLLSHTEPGECILYLWQNQHTVVIGKNQNCWKECNVSLLEEEGGRLVRRLSGGGAVYHDLGNLNFTFLVRKADYDLDRQLSVIAGAVESFGIPVEKSGRNDLLAAGRKFSGNAFYESGDFCYHHGTLLVDVDTGKMGRYLTVSKEKLKSKGVDSVRSRVGNLKELCPKLTIQKLSEAMKKSFAEVYGGTAKELCFVEDRTLKEPEMMHVPEDSEQRGERFDVLQRPKENEEACQDWLEKEYFPPEADAEIRKLQEKYASWDWKYGRKIPFTHVISSRFPWGGVELQLEVDGGVIQKAALYTDSLCTEISGFARELEGMAYERNVLCNCAEQSKLLPDDLRGDMEGLLREKI